MFGRALADRTPKLRATQILVPFCMYSGRARSPAALSPSQAMVAAAIQHPAKHFYQNRALDVWLEQPLDKLTLRQLVVFGRAFQPQTDALSSGELRQRLIRSGN